MSFVSVSCWRNGVLVTLLALLGTISALHYDPAYLQYNLNQNKTAIDPLDYWGEWTGHQYTPSPTNWRFPFYTLFLDRFVNGDPSNDSINQTAFEHDPNSNQMRHGGDLQGLVDTLDYIQGMGIRGLYIAGSPFINQPWGYDQYSPLDLTVLDAHLGSLEMWRTAVNEIHARNMYVVLDNTFATMGDLIGFKGYLNTTTPFTLSEHQALWKTDRRYEDFNIGNTYNQTCDYPRFWLETGFPVGEDVTRNMVGCYDSEFDQYGDTEAFGVFQDWRRQLSKFASVQDRLREWHEPVRLKLENFYCMLIAQTDIDGFRYDKATQSTLDALGFMSSAMRSCAEKYGKNNFFLPGEITGGNVFGSLYVGRGRQPDMVPEDLTQAVTMNNASASQYFIRDPGYNALDSAAFHYTVYRTLTRFLGMDGNLEAGFDAPPNWVNMWNTMLLTNDFVNPNTGVFDPRHMYGVTNQDVFRWPAINDGVARQLLGHFITTIHLPGIPLVLWGEEQAFYILDSTSSNYMFGRQAMSSATAWQTHGCYALGSSQYYNMPLEAARHGCTDETASYDHRDPSHPVRNIIRHMHQLRQTYPVLNDGFLLQQLSNQTQQITYPGSSGTATETGMWSVVRSEFTKIQDLADNTPVWLVYSNENATKAFTFDCKNVDTTFSTTALIAPFDAGTTVRNLFYPYDVHVLEESKLQLGISGSTKPNGCLSRLSMVGYDFRAYVPLDKWVGPKPMVTNFSPGHDARIEATDGSDTLDIEIQFSVEMNCVSVLNSITLNSTTETRSTPTIDQNTVKCQIMPTPEAAPYVGAIGSTWSFSATLKGVDHGVHTLTIRNATAQTGEESTESTDRFLFRVGQSNNPIVFPRTANYSASLLHKNQDGGLSLSHTAAGADLWRYSTNWGSSFSDWMPYEAGSSNIERLPWSGTSLQAWTGDHVRVEYFSRMAGGSDHIQQSDLGEGVARRFPHLFINGPYNQYGYDAGLDNKLALTGDSEWSRHLMVEWSPEGSLFQLSVWGMNPDGNVDHTIIMGDVNGDSILDRLPPSGLSATVLNVTEAPPKPHLGWRLVVNDGSLHFQFVPSGSMWTQIALYILLWTVPVVTASVGVWSYLESFYQVKFNQFGITEKVDYLAFAFKRSLHREGLSETPRRLALFRKNDQRFLQAADVALNPQGPRRTVLIATMEYDIEDWAIKIKIGGLGVMAQLMGKNLGHQNLIWCVPCVGDVEYPIDERAHPMAVTVLGINYEVQVQYHVLRNITYVLLDAPVFRQQMKASPYPSRMDDLESAIYYSAWNQCIAQTINRFPIDLYHINDYHGSLAPFYLLPRSIPVCLSLHNAEFQGLWPMRDKKESEEVCKVFNLPSALVTQYVQFGEVFNLLHAGASYLRVYQDGFGAVGVSRKYGKRSYARYPIFWGLKKIGKLPNPDPSDTGEWDKKLPKESDIQVDPEFEAARPELKRQAQEWAGLKQDPKAELFVFVGRWSMQKGIDLIADVFPSILEANQHVQLICVGPIIDLYGKFAALKLSHMAKRYPGRVFSRPVFTALPPFMFSGAEYALIPSRDEPFGLVAVEFGRKGALGVGARVGGLGQMPGWWYTVESTTTSHLLHQFRQAIKEALLCPADTKAVLRARSAKQRFPVAQWIEDLEVLQSGAIRIHDKIEGTRQNDPVDLPIIPSFEGPKMSEKQYSEYVDSQAPSESNHSVSRMKLGDINRFKVIDPDTFPRPKSMAASIGSHRPRRIPSYVSRRPVSMAMSLGSRRGPGHAVVDEQDESEPAFRLPPLGDDGSDDDAGSLFDEHIGDSDDEVGDPGSNPRPSTARTRRTSAISGRESPTYGDYFPAPPNPWLGFFHAQRRPISRGSPLTPATPGTPASPTTPDVEAALLPPPMIFAEVNGQLSPNLSSLSIDSVVGEKTDFKLQKVDPSFSDISGESYHAFGKKLENLNGSNSTSTLCIEEFLIRAEKRWFDDFRNAKLGRNPGHATPRLRDETAASQTAEQHASEPLDIALGDEFLLGKDYVPPTGVKKWMQIRVAGWPIYALFMGLGQILAANSYQITLLTGEVGQTAGKLYAIASIYLATSLMWWYLSRCSRSVICLSLPFFFYGLAFAVTGMAHFASTVGLRGWIQNVGTAFYAVASSSGSIFFALNFGDEGGAQMNTWVFRASVMQGTQQIYVVALWYWGSFLNRQSVEGIIAEESLSKSWKVAAVTLPIAMILWAVGLILWFGLPDYYRQSPGKMPSFYLSLFRRKIIMWFLFAVVIQNFFLSSPYGRNWSFLWSSSHASTGQVIALVLFFFVGVWAGFLWIFGVLSKRHSWILPLFAIGLGAPRWAQIWWGTSNIGLYLPWAGGYTLSALVSRALWLWLGVLDSIQGVGLGIILLATLTRVHVAFTLILAQVLGSLATILARVCAPNRIGPGPISPDISGGVEGLFQAWFWVGLLLNLSICVGYFMFYRKEQLSKP